MTFGRQLSSCRHRYQNKAENCYSCGARKFDNAVLKTTGFCNPIHTNMKLYFKQMKRRSAKTLVAKEIAESTYNLLTTVCQKFSYGTQTLALSLHIYQSLREMSQYEKFWASCCLIVASKGMQLDKNVPYLNRFQRYADKDHTQEEYQTAERTIFEGMNFDIQYSTFVTFINYYLTSGVVFAKDDLNKSLVQYFEDDTLLKAKEYLRKGNFSQWDQEKLALVIIKEIRKKYNLTEWNDQLQILTGFKNQQVTIEEQQKALQPRKYDLNSASSIFTMPKAQKVVDLKNICIRKKLDEVSISKTLVTKNSRPNSSTKQNSLSAISTTGYLGSQNSISFNANNSLLNQKLKSANIVLAPINTQYLSNNSIFNLATKRR